jgi:hypothetical protein
MHILMLHGSPVSTIKVFEDTPLDERSHTVHSCYCKYYEGEESKDDLENMQKLLNGQNHK